MCVGTDKRMLEMDAILLFGHQGADFLYKYLNLCFSWLGKIVNDKITIYHQHTLKAVQIKAQLFMFRPHIYIHY